MPNDFAMLNNHEIILHVGAHKTASSFLQTTARAHAQRLRADGVSFVHRAYIMKSAFYEEIAKILVGEPAPSKPPEEALESFRKLTHNKKRSIVFSNEDMLNRIQRTEFYPNTAEALRFVKAFVGDAPVKIIFYTRSQPDYLESIYMQFMHLGRSFTFQSFLRRYQRIDLSWLRVVDDMASVLGRENVVVIPYESIKRVGGTAYYHTFLAHCGVRQPARYHVAEEMQFSRGANRSYSADALKIAHAVNPLLSDEDKPKLRIFLQENFSTATHPKAQLLSEEQRVEMLAKHSEANRRLFEVYMPEWGHEFAHYVSSLR